MSFGAWTDSMLGIPIAQNNYHLHCDGQIVHRTIQVELLGGITTPEQIPVCDRCGATGQLLTYQASAPGDEIARILRGLAK
jgi:hypothetical protein